MTGGVGVPISTFRSYLEPEFITALPTIFDEVWKEINLLPGAQRRRKMPLTNAPDLAQMIFHAHKSGIPPERIKAAVLGHQIPGPPKPASRRTPL